MRVLGTEHSANTSGGGNGIGFSVPVGQWGSHVYMISLCRHRFCRKHSISLINYFSFIHSCKKIMQKAVFVHFIPLFVLFRQFEENKVSFHALPSSPHEYTPQLMQHFFLPVVFGLGALWLI